MKKRGMGLAIGLSLALFGMLLMVVVGAIWFLADRSVEMTDADRRMVVSAEVLAPFFEGFTPNSSHEVISKSKSFDNSISLEYEYDSPKDDEPYIAVTIAHHINKSNADAHFSTEWTAQSIGVSISNGKISEGNVYYRGGDRSRFGNLKMEGVVVGHLFVAQKGNSVYAFSIGGFTMEEPELWSHLFDDRIESLQSWADSLRSEN